MMDPAEGEPSLSLREQITRITLRRPQRHNRFEPADIALMSQMLPDLGDRRDVRALVITASGRSFRPGFDLTTLSGPRARECTAAFASLCDMLESLPVPTVCGISGDVYGGATDLALACDFRIGIQGAKLQMSLARLGIQYWASGAMSTARSRKQITAMTPRARPEEIASAALSLASDQSSCVAGVDLPVNGGLTVV